MNIPGRGGDLTVVPGPVLVRFRFAILLLTLAVFCSVATTARADVSSWLFLGGGPSGLVQSGHSGDVAGAMQIDAGMGSSPAGAIAVGGLARVLTRFGTGTDLGLFVRTATGGFVRGNWGGALDLGGFGRFWNQTVPGYAGTLSVGAPWGITLSLDAARDTNGTTALSAVLGIDLARFSVYRSTGTGWFPNPFPTPPARERL